MCPYRTWTLAATLVVAAVLAPAALASSYPGTQAPDLERRLPTSVSVFCTQNTSENFALIDQQEIYLDTNTCGALRHQPSAYSFGLAAHILYHEWWHVAARETNEKWTECGSYVVTRWALRHLWGMTRAQAQRAYDDAAGFSVYAPLPCSANGDDPVRD